MQFQITISLDNDVFKGETCGAEIKRILLAEAERMGQMSEPELMEKRVRDVNGNHVGMTQIYSQ